MSILLMAAALVAVPDVLEGQQAVDALVGNTVIIRLEGKAGETALHLRRDGTAAAYDAGPPRKTEAVKWSLDDEGALCIIGAGEDKLPVRSDCATVSLAGDVVTIRLLTDDHGESGDGGVTLQGRLVSSNPLKL